ncbi:MAG: phosphoribosylglycinamide formyltransferase [Rhizobiaceae bacterium]|nr:phosphoribosylglycinamide formyltransferase [Rhizobiaceae bacterium]
MKKLKVAVMISGRGSNMGSLARAAMDPEYPVEIVLVLSNKPHAEGLDLAQQHGLPIRVVDQSAFDSRGEHELGITQALQEAGAELICMAGYMRILEDAFVNEWRGRLINIHPSLLPSFIGLETHARALERGVRIHGCSVHFVTNELDAGPIVAQAAVAVEPGDDKNSLAARVLEAEHELYPQALKLIADGKIRWTGDDSVSDNNATADDVAIFR